MRSSVYSCFCDSFSGHGTGQGKCETREKKDKDHTEVNTDSTLTALNKPDSAKEPSTLVADLCLTVHLNERQVSCATFYTKKELNNSQSCSKSHVAVL